MSSLFGQVWLWSLLSFVAGVALTWLVLVRPAKRELEDLEERLLTSPRPTPSATPSARPTPAPEDEARDEFDDWHAGASRSPADEVPTPEPAEHDRAERDRAGHDRAGHDRAGHDRAGQDLVEPPRYEHVEAPRHDVSNMKLDKRDELLEELDDEHRPVSDFEEQHDFPEFEDDRPRSLFERLAPEPDAGPDSYRPDGSRSGGSRSEGPRAPGPTPEPRQHAVEPVVVERVVEVEPELPVEETHLMPAIPVAEPAPHREEPTAPPEVEFFQPREVWREEPVLEVRDRDEVTDGREQDDEPERRGNEETALIPATALAEAIAEVDRRERPAEPEPESLQVWPEHDLTGHFAPVDVGSRRDEPSEPGTRTEVMKAVVDDGHTRSERSRPEWTRAFEATPEPPAAEPEPEPDPAPVAVTPDEPRRSEPERFEPEPFEPTFVEQPSEAAEPRAADVEPVAAAPDEPERSRPRHAEPQQPAPAKPAEQPAPAAAKKDEPPRPRSLFEPLVTPEEELESEQQTRPPRPAAATNDQPFVPTLAPELLASTGGNGVPASGTGLPQRPTRSAGTPRPSSPAPLSAQPQQIKPPSSRPVRPRPVGFSPSTGGRPAAGSSRYQGRQEGGFNPRSPFGPGSVLPKSDGLAPAPEFQVKATLTGRRYFTAESANFRETRADVWFRTTTDAEKAGFRQAP